VAESPSTDKAIWLANQIYEAFPEDASGLKLYILDCACIYYQMIYRDGELDSEVGIYRDADDGPCQKCMLMEETWKERVVDRTVVYNSKFQVE
jgi:hypothetical protein